MEVHRDNLTVVTVLRSGKTKNSTLAAISRNIFMTTSKYDIYLKISHIPGKSNKVADLLSRWEKTTSNLVKLKNLLPSYTWVKVDSSKIFLDYDI